MLTILSATQAQVSATNGAHVFFLLFFSLGRLSSPIYSPSPSAPQPPRPRRVLWASIPLHYTPTDKTRMLKSSVIFTLLSSLATPFTSAAVTVYTATSTSTADLSLYTVASNDRTILQVPAPPTGQAATVLAQLYDGGMTGMGNLVVRSLFRSAPPPLFPL